MIFVEQYIQKQKKWAEATSLLQQTDAFEIITVSRPSRLIKLCSYQLSNTEQTEMLLF